MNVDAYFKSLGLTELYPEEFSAALRLHEHHPVVQEFGRRHAAMRNDGDARSLRALYEFVYTATVPGLGLRWADAFTCAYMLDFERATMPALAEFCVGATEILEGGCGAGFALGYVALTCPQARVTAVDTLPQALLLSVERARTLGLHGLTLLRSDVGTLADDLPERFDRILLRNVFGNEPFPLDMPAAHLDETIACLRGICALLRPDGRVWFSVSPERESIREVEGQLSCAIGKSGLRIEKEQHILYRRGVDKLVHLVWILQQP